MEKEVLTFRKATKDDVTLIVSFIRGIAEYEKMLDQVELDPDTLKEEIFDNHRAEVVFALENGKEVGFALYFYNFSTFVGHSGLYLEDLFVFPQYRHKGYGKALIVELSKIAKEKGCGRMDWVCLDWNKPSQDFYASLGAKPLHEWLLYRLDRKGIEKLSSDND
ncbi:MAG: GNAT family N-acetyltransferase [Bacilli bacterium]|jgi:GNAT superfamily N-acetyltransferase|nr:GNAT family N-acetyltransferase [Bacilli bacterium]MCH4210191.1 GNAT family N-acetyltransferase [Bacilli bacterium]MCH4228172.1 GNAT family N-acetyltransferase [Bacilli bacterium]MCH4277830.1 GNAT family N-acetyltransferase [Bacilli bacterium]MCI2055189.1 GNAT family N-acetyltransferase [Bacilli bacterium]